MDKILGMPRNAAIVLGAMIVSVGAMAAGLLIPWGNNQAAPGEPGKGSAAGGGPASTTPIVAATAAPHTTAPVGAQAELSLAGLEYKRISVDFDGQPAEQAMQAFSDATGIQVDMGNSRPNPNAMAPPPVSMHLKNASFLEGLLQLANNTWTMPQSWTDDHVVLQRTSDIAVGKWCVSGPFGIVLQRLQATADLQHPTATTSTQGTISFDFYSDPSIKIALYPTTVSIDQFEDEKHQLLFAGSGGGSSGATRNLPHGSLQLPMSMPAERGRKIALLRGSAVFVVANKTQQIQTAGPDASLNENIGEAGIEILPIKNPPPTGGPAPGFGGQGGTYTLTVRYHRRVANSEKWNRLINIAAYTQPDVFDDADRQLQGNFYATNSERQGEELYVQSWSLRFNAQNGNPVVPHHIRFEIPSDLREYRVRFEFKDLILP